MIISPSLQVSDLSEPPCNDHYDMVDSDRFWQQVENEMLAKGLTKGTQNTHRVHVDSLKTGSLTTTV